MADTNMPSVTNSGNHFVPVDIATYKQKYRILKRKLKFLLYEQESFQEELRRSQRKLLRVSKDKSFLLDQLLQVEGLDFPSSEDEETAISSSDDELQKKIAADSGPKEKRSKKQAQGVSNSPIDSSIHHQATSTQDTKIDHNNQIRCKFVEN
ncbi:INO80 complex subunit E isoform X2, partial [Paramuricea clavata]